MNHTQQKQLGFGLGATLPQTACSQPAQEPVSTTDE